MRRDVLRRAIARAVLLGLGAGAAAGLAALLAADGAEGQEAVWIGRAPSAWLGLSYEVEWLARGGACEPRVVVESVIQGAPADRAGLRPGDAILALNGTPVGGTRLQLVSSRLSVGDSVRLTVLRDGRPRDLLALADRRPDRPPVAMRVEGDGLFASDAPVVLRRADTLVVRNVEPGGAVARRGYWLATGDGRAEFRRVDRFSGDALDREVVDLLVCAQRTQAAAPVATATGRLSLREVQEKADSVREMWVRQRMTGAELERIRSAEAIRVEVAPTPPPPPGVRTIITTDPDVQVYSFRVGDHVLALERGVAGAEVTPLEPELAEYFRGAGDGLLVLRVAPGTPAARAGLRPGDVITSGGGRTLRAVPDLRLLLTLPDPTPVELRVVRHGRTRTLTIRRD